MSAHTAARLFDNSRWNFLAFCIAVAANFLALPVAIAAIGMKEFGAAGLVLALFAPFTLVGTVLGQALVREFGVALMTEDYALMGRVFSAACALCIACCAFVVSILTTLGPHLLERFANESIARDDWTLNLLLCGLGWSGQQLCLLMQSTLAASQRYRVLAVANGISAIMGAVALIFITWSVPSLTGYILGTTTGFLLTLLIIVPATQRGLDRPLQLVPWRREDMTRLIGFGKWQAAASLAGGVGNQVDRYALGVLAHPSVVGQYNVSMRLQEVVYAGVLKITEVIYPHFSISQGQGQSERARFFLRACWVLNAVSVIAIAPLVPSAEALIALWIDPITAKHAAPMLRSLAVAGVLGGGMNVYFYFALASGQTAQLAILSIAHSVILVVSSILLIRAFGPSAAGGGYVLANALRLIAVLHLSEKAFFGQFSDWAVVQSTALPIAFGLAASWLLSVYFEPQPASWLHLIAYFIFASVCIAAATAAAAVLTKQGRSVIHDVGNLLRRAIPRRS